MYASINFKTKKQLKEAVATGKVITVYQPGYGTVPKDGVVFLEGPHAPASHTWYAEVTLHNGVIVKVK